MTVAAVMAFSSCTITKKTYVPQAVNMVNTIYLEELNLTSSDYEILDRVETSAKIVVEMSVGQCIIKDPEGSFEMKYSVDLKNGNFYLIEAKGVVRAGYLTTRELGTLNLKNPEEIALRLAMYRIVSLVKQQGGDGVVEPVVSSSVEGKDERNGKTVFTYQTTVSGKIIRLKTK